MAGPSVPAHYTTLREADGRVLGLLFDPRATVRRREFARCSQRYSNEKTRLLAIASNMQCKKIGLHVRHSLPFHVMYQKPLIPRQKRVLPRQCLPLPWQNTFLARNEWLLVHDVKWKRVSNMQPNVRRDGQEPSLFVRSTMTSPSERR